MSDETTPFAPPFVRLNYFQGQMLSASDFRLEQATFRNKRRLLNRMVLGHGVAYGLDVTIGNVVVDDCPVTPDGRSALALQTEIARLRIERDRLYEMGCHADADALQADIDALRAQLDDLDEARADGDEPGAPVGRALRVGRGYALDCHGQELVVRDAVSIDPFAPGADGKRVVEGIDGDTGTLLLSIKYAEEPLHPTRPMGGDPCDDPGEVHFARIRESVSLELELVDPVAAFKERYRPKCDPTEGCGCGSVALALVTVIRKGDAWLIEYIDRSIRRPLAVNEPTRIAGISWRHGHTYLWDETPSVMQAGDGQGGILLYFTRPVREPVDLQGIVDLTLTAGGAGMAGSIRNIACDVELINSGGALRIKQRSNERFNDGDRITLTVRASHLIDECGRPVLGANLGGLIPPMDKRAGRGADLPAPPGLGGVDMMLRHFQPWHTGAGGDFVSWIHIASERRDDVPAGPDGDADADM